MLVKIRFLDWRKTKQFVRIQQRALARDPASRVSVELPLTSATKNYQHGLNIKYHSHTLIIILTIFSKERFVCSFTFWQDIPDLFSDSAVGYGQELVLPVSGGGYVIWSTVSSSQTFTGIEEVTERKEIKWMKKKYFSFSESISLLYFLRYLSWQWLAITASLFVLVKARWEFPITMTASRHLDRVNWTMTETCFRISTIEYPVQ